MEYLIDATDKKLGRLASEIALLLQGKNTARYNPRLPGDEKVLVKNVSKVVVTGRKHEQKIYYHHTGYMGHLRERKFKEVFQKSPEKVLWKAVYNMLTKNRLRIKRLKRLKIER